MAVLLHEQSHLSPALFSALLYSFELIWFVKGTHETGLVVAGGGTFSGDATYYEDGTIGACSQKKKPAGFRTVAINSQQWAGGSLCGTCIEGSYTENGQPYGSSSFVIEHRVMCARAGLVRGRFTWRVARLLVLVWCKPPAN
jgi:hypothetical protein